MQLEYRPLGQTHTSEFELGRGGTMDVPGKLVDKGVGNRLEVGVNQCCFQIGQLTQQ